MQFYRRRGWKLVAIHFNAVDKARRIKPEIPLRGEAGIPMRDEFELQRSL